MFPQERMLTLATDFFSNRLLHWSADHGFSTRNLIHTTSTMLKHSKKTSLSMTNSFQNSNQIIKHRIHDAPPPPPPTPLIPQMKVDFVWMWIPHMGSARNLRKFGAHARPLRGARRGRAWISFSIWACASRRQAPSSFAFTRSQLICWPLLPTFLGGLGTQPNEGRTSPWQMSAGQAGAANISWSASAGRRSCCCVQGFQNSTSLLPSCGKSLFWMCTKRLVTSINMAGGACKCGVGSLVHRRKFDRSHSDGAVLCAGVSFSWARLTQQPNESWVSRRIW